MTHHFHKTTTQNPNVEAFLALKKIGKCEDIHLIHSFHHLAPKNDWIYMDLWILH